MLETIIKEDGKMSDLFKINTNVQALRALNTLQGINDEISKTQERISTGKTVNRASDDPSRYFISKLFETSISKLVSGQVELERGIDFLEKNNSRLDQAASLIIEVTDLVNTANSGSISSAEQQAISREIKLLVDVIDNILQSGVATEVYNGFTAGGLENVSLSGNRMTLSSLGIENSSLVVTGTSTQFTTALNNLSTALTSVLEAEEILGAWVSRLEFENEDLAITEIADRGSLSTIMDADLAEEQVRLSALQILQQTSLIGLIQANTAPGAVLNLVSA
jgi:flagellin